MTKVERYADAVQDKVWIEDPDGNAWEVFVVKSDSPLLQEQAPSVHESAASEGCCVPTLHGIKRGGGGCCP